METDHGFSRSQIQAIFEKRGLKPPSTKQLQYWATTGLIEATIPENKRPRYSFSTLLDIMVICELQAGGIPLQRIRKALDFLEDQGWRTKPGKLKALNLVTDGSDIYMVTGLEDVMSLLRQPGQIAWKAFCLPAAQIVKETARIIELSGWRDRLTREEQSRYLAA